MALYQSISSQEVVGRIIRNTRVQDTSYIMDMKDWISEAMGIMKTRYQLSHRYQDIIVNFHKAKLPIDLDHITAVECNGRRIPEGNGSRSNEAPHQEHQYDPTIATPSPFQYVPQYYNTPGKANPQEDSHIFTWTETPIACQGLPCAEGHWYNVEMGYITTSLKRAKIRIHYKAMPVDEFGMLLIPDNEDYLQAVYYYCRAMMIGAGYPDKVFDFDKIMRKVPQKGYFWQHAETAIGAINYPSVDSMEYKVNITQRLIKDNLYFDKFFETSKAEKIYGYDGEGFSSNGGLNGTYPNQPRPYNGQPTTPDNSNNLTTEDGQNIIV